LRFQANADLLRGVRTPILWSFVRCVNREVELDSWTYRQAWLTPAVPARRREPAMTQHRTGTREGWLAARLELLGAEKELTRRSDELGRQRQQLPCVRIDKDYRFETDDGRS
jgi:hypothetical protein